MNTELAQSASKTLAYFDLFNYPLTKEELYDFLWQPPAVSYADFLLENRHAPAGLAITSKFGYFFLAGKEKNIELRRKRLVVSELKLKIARKAAKKLRSVPFLKAIFVCNSVGFEQAADASDIDFFIITDPGRIWIARFFANFILLLFGLRVTAKSAKNKICLSFFADSEHLDMSRVKTIEDDVYLVYWLCRLFPLYDPDNFFAKLSEANKWMKQFTPNFNPEVSAAGRLRVEDSRAGRVWKKVWEKMWIGAYGDIVERQAKAYQWAKLKFSIKEKAKNDPLRGVVLEDGMLKFHENDARLKYREEWKKRANDKFQITNVKSMSNG